MHNVYLQRSIFPFKITNLLIISGLPREQHRGDHGVGGPAAVRPPPAAPSHPPPGPGGHTPPPQYPGPARGTLLMPYMYCMCVNVYQNCGKICNKLYVLKHII